MAKARIAFGICITACLAAAVEPLKLEDYVPADFHRQYLSVQPRLSWVNSESDMEMDAFSRHTSNAGPSAFLQLQHGSERFTRDFRWRIDCGSELDANRGENHVRDMRPAAEASSFSQTTVDARFRYSAYTRLSAQKYLRGDFFLAPALGADWQHTPASTYDNDSWWAYPEGFPGDSIMFNRSRSDDDQNGIRTSGKARVDAGIGRIEDVRFAETGLFILDRIAETTGKPLGLDAQGMRELEAAVESRRKQRPFLDFRRATIFDLETVAKFLQERRGGEALPARAILEMADEWHYGGMHSRKSGWEAKVYPFVEWTWNDNHESSVTWRTSRTVASKPVPDGDSLARVLDAGLGALTKGTVRRFDAERTFGAGARLDWNRPWNRFWQFNAMAYVRAARVAKEFGDERAPGDDRYIEFAYPVFEAGASLEAAWYPDSRTSLSTTGSLGWTRNLDYLGSKSTLTAHLGETPVRRILSVHPALRCNGEYWLSPRMTANGLAELAYDWNETRGAIEYLPSFGQRTERGWISGASTRFDAGLKYYLF